MAMGRRNRERQNRLWIETGELVKSPGHPFYERLNRLLDEEGFDGFVEEQCSRFYAERMGRPSLAPALYFRLLLIGYFEGIDSERGIAWRVSDSLSLREFLGLELSESAPDHSTLSRTRRLIDLESHEDVFAWILGVLARASGIETPTREDLARIDKNRKGKGSNNDWTHPHDPDATITKMKDGRTKLAHKAGHGCGAGCDVRQPPQDGASQGQEAPATSRGKD